ncbi:MAG: leucine-rich repeat domain-containing protein [Ruminococcaceae bacterium]|nr:leucine-rich repeat domain-containing protein [Oscillospiraceae bacterium]
MFKKLIAAALILMMLVPMMTGFASSAATVKYSGTNAGPNVSWYIDTDGLLYLYGSGDTYDFEALAYAPWHIYRSEIKSILVQHGVTGVGKNAFVGLNQVTAVTLSYTVARIGKSAFNSCTALPSIVLPPSVNYIGDGAFMYCQSLTSFVIPDAVTYIGEGAFTRCDNLQVLHISAANPSYICEYGVLYNKNKTELIVCPSGTTLTSYTLPASCVSIQNDAFYGCKNLQSVTLPSGITSIPENCFCFCTSLKEVNVQGNITFMGNAAFSNCTALENLILPANATEIPDFAFTHCYALTDIVIPEGVTTIGQYAFNYCTALSSVSLPSTLTTISEGAFKYIPNELYLDIPSSVTEIGNSLIDDSPNITIRCSIFSYAYDYAMSKSYKVETYETVESISVNTMPDKTVYGIAAEKLDMDGFTLNLHLTNGDVRVVDAYYTVTEPDFSTGGDKVVTVTYGDHTTAFNIFVDETIFTYPESDHPYHPFEFAEWNFKYPGHADQLLVTFSEDTLLEGYDDLELYTVVSGTSWFGGDELAGKTVAVKGSSFRIVIRSSGGEKTYGFKVTNVVPVCNCFSSSVDGVDLTVEYPRYDIKDIFVAKGEYTTYTEVNANKIVRLTATKLSATSTYNYTLPGAGIYTVLFRTDDGRMEIQYVTVDVTEPEFTPNGLQLNVANLDGIKVIRTSTGEHKTAASIKKTEGARAFTAKDVLAGVDNYTIQYREAGRVTVAVCYENGYSAFYIYDVTKKTPEMTQRGNKVTFTNLDDLKVIRYAKGEYTTSGDIKRAEGSVGITPKKIVDGAITVTLKPGTYTFCVQYNDESYNYYTITVE